MRVSWSGFGNSNHDDSNIVISHPNPQKREKKWGTEHFSASVLLQELADEGVIATDQLMEGAVEDEAAFFEHEEGCAGVGFAFGEGNHAALLGVEVVVAEGEGVL